MNFVGAECDEDVGALWQQHMQDKQTGSEQQLYIYVVAFFFIIAILLHSEHIVHYRKYINSFTIRQRRKKPRR